MPWRAMPLAPVAIAFAAGVGLAPWARPDVAWTTWLAALASTGALLLTGRTAGATALLLVGVAAVGALHGIEAPLPPGHVDRLTPVDHPAPPWPERIKRASVAAISQALPRASAALLAGLLLGERTALPPELDEGFRRAGVYHVLAVSGFNVVLLAAAVLALCRLARVGRRVSAVAAIVVVVGFAAVVGPEPSVLRAVVMAVLVLAALLLEREASVTNSLALAALAILAIRPGDLLDPGFQLSFAATAGIVAAPMPRGVIAGAIAVSAAAQLAVLPLTLTHFHHLSTIGVVVNLGVVPLAGVATVAGLLAVASPCLSAGAAQS